MEKETKITAEETPKSVAEYLKMKDPSFSMFTASNRTYPLIEWMNKIEEFADLKCAPLIEAIEKVMNTPYYQENLKNGKINAILSEALTNYKQTKH